MKSAIIVGGGMCGCTVAHLLKKNNWKVTIFEKESYIGGGCRTFFYGSHPYTIGPRPLYTPHQKVYDFLNKFVKMGPMDLYLDTFVEKDGNFYSYPIHVDDIPRMPESERIYRQLQKKPEIKETMNFEEYYRASIGNILYDKFVNNYSKKMWGVQSNKELTDFQWSLKGIALKKGSKKVREELIIAHPLDKDGYNQYFQAMVKDVDQVNLNCGIERFDLAKRGVYVDGSWLNADVLISTTSVDMLMDYAFGVLKYIGRDFIKFVLPVEQAIAGDASYLYYSSDEPFTRIVEYKKLYRYKSNSTLLGIEIPSFKNKMYPYPIKSERDKAQKYLDSLPDKVFSLGRMGRYVYDNIGDVIIQAFEVAEKLK
jgi:UDP-galactopyranose mutase